MYLSVQGQLGSNTKAVTLALEKALHELEPELAREQIKSYPRLFRPANFIETAIDGIRTDILIGSALVITVLFFIPIQCPHCIHIGNRYSNVVC